MSVHRIPILGFGSMPDSSGDVFFEPYEIKGVGVTFNRLVLVFNDTSNRDGIAGGFTVPKNYVDNAKIIVVWTTTANTGDVDWDFDYRAVGGDDSESLDQALQEAVTVNDIAPGTSQDRMESVLALTSSNFAVDDEVEFEFFRDGATEGVGGISVAIVVFSLLFEYTDV